MPIQRDPADDHSTRPSAIRPTPPKNIIYTVSKLTAGIKALLEDRFPFVWVTGEISNFNVPISGHFYFTLKDEQAQIGAVMFRGQNRNLKYRPADGMRVTGLGRISVYEPRGTYQIIFEYLEPKGVGELQIAFEQLKAKLSQEGLFDERHKKALPFLPQRIAVITSPTGAVIHDILKIIYRRFPNVQVQILPVKVQGEGAEREIAGALELLNLRTDAQVAILARGGGSFEDLNVFNSEAVARAIFASRIPIVSAVGHETDFTIADFVADLRAPTPSAAAELLVPLKQELERLCGRLHADLKTGIRRYLLQHRKSLDVLTERLADPRKRLQDFRLKIDDLMLRLIRLVRNGLDRKRERVEWWTDRLQARNPRVQVEYFKEKLYNIEYKLLYYIKLTLKSNRDVLEAQTSKLKALSPTAILARGYSITRSLPDAQIVSSADAVRIGQDLQILLAKGWLVCRVRRKSIDGQENV